MANAGLEAIILRLAAQAAADGLLAKDIEPHVSVSRPTVHRALGDLVATGRLLRLGAGRATRYKLPSDPKSDAVAQPPVQPAAMAFTFSPAAHALLTELRAPMGSRKPVGYQRSFLDDYRPNESHLLPLGIAETLFAEGRSRDQQPAGTYARKVLEQLLIDLSWNSSRLEGNHFNLLDTRELFRRGRGDDGDRDATMLLNHKEAIEFLVDAVPEQGITVPVVRNLHGILMQGLLADETAVGTIRRRVINISQSVYIPTQMPALIEEMLEQLVSKAWLVKNPIEAAFLLWVNIAYLQPFEDGNKRTSRLAANLPLLLTNCAPLSFLDVEVQDYAYAMLGVYERIDTRLAAELFTWTYRRSIDKYRVAREAIGAPDPLRARYRAQISEIIQRVVGGDALDEVMRGTAIPEADRAAVREMVTGELRNLELYNYARFRLAPGAVERWIAGGRNIEGDAARR
jgi:fido (protein-threonine AMPylation protein)